MDIEMQQISLFNQNDTGISFNFLRERDIIVIWSIYVTYKSSLNVSHSAWSDDRLFEKQVTTETGPS